jgi:hypothetical protein
MAIERLPYANPLAMISAIANQTIANRIAIHEAWERGDASMRARVTHGSALEFAWLLRI